MARIRSPNYPAIGLRDAITRIQKIHAKAHTHKVDAETMAKASGYAGINGAALSMLSALKKYGLLDEVGKELKVSPRALTIIADSVDSPDRRAAIQAAAFDPELFADIRKQFPGKAPNDEIVRSYLVKRSFGAGALDAAISAFKETVDLVTSDGIGYSTDGSTATLNATLENATMQSNVTVSPPSGSMGITGNSPTVVATNEIGTYPVSADCKIKLLATGPYDRTSIKALVDQLGLALELGVFPETKN